MANAGHRSDPAFVTLVFLVNFVLTSPLCFAEKPTLTILTVPPGATVEIDGQPVGKTPYVREIYSTYLHGTRSVFGLSKLLRQPVRVHLSLDGYLPKDVELTYGPLRWVALNGVDHGEYWLLKSAAFTFTLDRAATTFAGHVEAHLPAGSSKPPRTELTTEAIYQTANPAVLFLKGSEGFGSGFIITETGVAVTNAHVARGQSSLSATAGNGQTFNARVEYIDSNLDIALLKLDGSNFPHLPIADISIIQPGSSVIAIGTPSQGFQNTITKGIVGAVGPMPSEPGTWIQTDAAINPGNSGGPLLDGYGEVVGINTQKRFMSGDGRPLQGIGFALSGSDLLGVLHRFFPTVPSSATQTSTETPTTPARISVSADVDNAEIYVDGKFVGSAPSTLSVGPGDHKISVRVDRYNSWEREIEVLSNSEINLKAHLTATQ
jgi:S1-C subfamily serine protease